MIAVVLDKLNRAEAFRYMGIKDGEGLADGRTNALADECEKRLLETCSPKYCRVFAEISDRSDGIAFRGNTLVLRGNDIAEHLDGCFGAVLLCATLGAGADTLIRRAQAEDMAKALVCDAMASAAVEQVCDIAEEEIRRLFPDRFTTWRFSAGYGDLPLDTQKDLLAALNAERAVGVSLNDGGLLTPAKSVTAVIGISDKPVERKKRGCVSCNMYDKCQFRKSGGHCGE